MHRNLRVVPAKPNVPRRTEALDVLGDKLAHYVIYHLAIMK